MNYVLSVTAAVTATVSAATTMEAREGMFIASIMPRVADMALTVARFISLKVVKLLRTVRRQRAVVAVARIVAVVDVAIKTVRAMEPGAGSNEYATSKPVGAVVAVGRAVIRSIVKISVRANGCGSDVDGNLGGRGRCAA